jgi:hypothetical protein
MFALKFVVCNKADVEQMSDNKTPELELISSKVVKSITFTGLVQNRIFFHVRFVPLHDPLPT